jgi:DNA-binding LytR/AlgR family response regulator
MNSLNSIIIDSGRQTLGVLENYLEDSPAIKLKKKFNDVTEAEDYCRLNAVDIVICNIETVEKKTIDTIKYVQPSTMIVCAGNRDCIENKSFEENIFGYLYKPFSYERILSLVSKANTFIGYKTNTSIRHEKSFVFVKSEYKTIRVDLNDILYCEGLRDYTQIYLKGKPKPLVTLQNLKAVCEKLPPSDFVRVHRSFIVSLDKIDSISKNEIAIGSAEVPIGDAYRERLFELIGTHS